MNNVENGNTAGIVSDVGGALGTMVPGQAGQIINSLNPVAANMTTTILDGNIGGAV